MSEIEGIDGDRREGNREKKGHNIGIGKETRHEIKNSKKELYYM